ncbi:MAG: sarcosine oxidase [Gammaproteobacteria bacterium]|nr:sarcosine oxidase [Gammaproteobacteria bacterium]
MHKAVLPQNVQHRSMLYRTLLNHGAVFASIGDSAIAAHFGRDDEARAARQLGISDLSPLPRTGFKSKNTVAWLEKQGVAIPERPNRSTVQNDGSLVARLSNDEHVILASLGGSGLPARLDEAWQIDTSRMCYRMPRAHSYTWLAVTGEHSGTMFSKVCGVDLRLHKFPLGEIAQTSLARINALIIRADMGSTAAFYVLADSASAEFLWMCLIDAMQEFTGIPVGVDALRTLV